MTRSRWFVAIPIALSCMRPVAIAAPAPQDSVVSVTPAAVAAFDTNRWVDSTLASLTPRRRVAQTVMPWVLGDYTSVDDSVFKEIVRWVADEGVGGLTM